MTACTANGVVRMQRTGKFVAMHRVELRCKHAAAAVLCIRGLVQGYYMLRDVPSRLDCTARMGRMPLAVSLAGRGRNSMAITLAHAAALAPACSQTTLTP